MTNTKMDIYGIKKDYLEGWIMMHFDGEYNEQEAIEYAQRYYSEVTQVTSFELPYQTPYGLQLGTVHFE